MYLEGQGECLRRRGAEHGYAMAALLVTLGVMAVLMSAALPVWRHQARREKEAELIFRGEQYARAVGLYQRKMGPGTVPPSIEVLVEQKFLRKKYKDPMVPDGEFEIVPFGAVGQPGVPGSGVQSGPPGTNTTNPQRQPQRPPSLPGTGLSPGSVGVPGTPTGLRGGGGVMGVVSKSKDAAIRIYRGGAFYNQWRFVYVQQQPGPGVGGDGRGGPGIGGGAGRGGRGSDGRRGRGPGIGGRGFPPPPGGRGFGGRGPGG